MLRAARGQREVDGRVEAIEDEGLAATIRHAARRIPLRAALLAVVLTAAVALCPS